MKKEANIIESVEFLAADDLLVSELDKRLSFTALTADTRSCNKYLPLICDCVTYCACVSHRPTDTPGASAVRG